MPEEPPEEVESPALDGITHLRFRAVEDLLAFLRKEGTTRQKREWEPVRVAPGGYSVSIPRSDWRPPKILFGAEFGRGQPTGNPLRMKELLCGIWLAERRTRLRRPTEVIVTIETPAGASQEDRRSAQSTLHEAWRTLPRTSTSSSHFFTAKEKQTGLDAILVTDVAPSLDFEALKRDHPHGRFRAFFREGRHEGEPFVEVGYHHPCGDDFALLSSSDDSAKLLLCYAGKRVHSTEGGKFYEPRWIELPANGEEVGEALYFTADTAVEATGGGNFAVDEPLQQRVHQPLAIDGTDRSVGAQFALDARIAVLEREVELLHGRRERRRYLAEGEFIPVYLWVQSEATEAGRLAGTFQSFLDRPLAELKHYSYFRHWNEAASEWWHFVMASAPMPAGDALAVACHYTFLQDVRWAEWGLPLYVRSDCALSVDVNEAEISDKLKEQLDLGSLNNIAAILVTPPGGITAPAETGSPAFYTLENTDALLRMNEALEWANEHGDGIRAAKQLIPVDFACANNNQLIEVQGQILRIDEALSERASQLLREVEGEWQTFREGATSQLASLRLGDILLEATKAPYAAAGESWVAFLKNTVAINNTIASARIEQIAAWDAAKVKGIAGLEKVAANLTPVETYIETTQEALKPLLNSATEACQNVTAELEMVRQARAELDAATKEFEQQFTMLTAERQKYDGEIAASESAIRLATEEISRLEVRKASATQSHAKAIEVRAKLAETKARAEAEEMVSEEDKKGLRAALEAAASFLGLEVRQPEGEKRKQGFWGFLARTFGGK